MLAPPRLRARAPLACALASLLFLSGCRSAPPAADVGAASPSPAAAARGGSVAGAGVDDPDGRARDPAPRPVGWFAYGASVEGRPLLAWAGEGAPEAGRARRALLLLASIHGSEGAGTPLLERLVTALEGDEAALLAGARVVVVPVANPDGLWGRARHNGRGVDLNRNFPAANFSERARHGEGPLSEPEARALHALIQAERPDAALSVHQPLACVDWDGPGEALAMAIAEACGLPARRLGGRPGSLGSWVGQALGAPIVTFELRRGDERLELPTLWERYGPGLRALLRWRP